MFTPKILEANCLCADMLLQVHDELIFETPKKNAQEVLSTMKDMMEAAVKLDIPLIAEAAIGTNWNEAH